MLIKTAKEKDNILATYVDDVYGLTIADTVNEALKKQVEMETGKEGLENWKRTHACQVEISKDSLIIFLPNRSKQTESPLIIGQQEIIPVKQVKYLGVIIDKELKWREQAQHALGKGMRTVAALKT